MKADTITLKDLFQKDVRYVIPTFQRPYVWNQEDQWEPLWEDVLNTAERYMEALAAHDGNAAKAEEEAGSHFMGAVVLQQQPNAAKELETRDVIDGQQRLTTMQLLLDAAQQAMEDSGHEEDARTLSRLVVNHFASGDDVFKLWPTSLDRDAFRAAMENDADSTAHATSRIVQAHEFFQLQVTEWIAGASDDAASSRRRDALQATLFGLLELVVIDLTTDDDAFVIFETLNARGTPLLASDLVKNFLLQTARSKGIDSDALYESTWKDLEDAWWRQDVRQGRITRPRLDQFLNYWLIMDKRSEVRSEDVFPEFKEHVEQSERSLTETAETLLHHGQVFRSLDDFEPDSFEAQFMYRWRTVEAGTSTPLLLWLLAQPADRLPLEERRRALAALESYLVRRMICRRSTKDYSRLFVELLSRCSKADEGTVADTVVTYLAAQESDSREWPDDLSLASAVIDLPLYRLLTRGRLRMVLEAIEDSMRTKYSEPDRCPRNLTIEHVMPQAWKDHWPLDPEADPTEATLARARLVHTLGNLTLVNDRLNPALSNAPWSEKSQTLKQHSMLRINQHLLDGYELHGFGDDEIVQRGHALLERVTTVWPRPSGGPA